MTQAERKQLSYFPKQLDAEIIKRFGAETEAKTELDFFGTMNYVTVFKAEGHLKDRIEDFIAAYKLGNQELSKRILNKSLWVE